MEKFTLFAYVFDFISFLMEDTGLAKNIDRIILFGSVARGEFDEESDVDMFIETEQKYKNLIYNRLKVFRQTEKWKLLGIKNDIRIYTGRLQKWPSIRRSIISDGILLYGKYKEAPEKLSQFLLISFSLENLKRIEKIKIWRKLYGYTQKINKKVYASEGLIKECKGKRFARGTFVIPAEYSQKIVDFLKSQKINHERIEIWTDYEIK